MLTHADIPHSQVTRGIKEKREAAEHAKTAAYADIRMLTWGMKEKREAAEHAKTATYADVR
jgi:hypothetical protein